MKKFTLLIVLISVLFNFDFYTQWQQKNGPYAGGKIIYDVGENLWVGTDGAGIFLYLDSTNSWTKFDLRYPTNPDVNAFTSTDSGVVAGTSYGVYRFDGTQWLCVNSDMIYVNDLAVDSLGRIWAATEIGLKVSNDYGRTWVTAFDSLDGMNFNAIIVKNGVVLAGSDNGVFRTTDWGETWEAINNGISNIPTVYDLVSVDNYIYMASSEGIYMTFDYGDTWSLRIYGLEGSTHSLLSYSDYYIFAATTEGVYKTTIYQSEWMEVDPIDLVYKESYSLAIHNEDLFAVTRAGIYKIDYVNTTTDIWEGVGLPLSSTFKFDTKDGKIYAATIKVGVLETTDHGENWKEIVDRNFGEGYAGFINDFACNSYGFYVAATGGFYRLINSDPHWRKEINGLDDFCITNVTASEFAVFISTCSNSVYYSISDGNQWHSASTGLPNATITDLAYCNYAFFAAFSSGNGIYRYDFNGSDSTTSWVEVNNGLENLFVNSLFSYNNTLYAATNSGLYKTVDNGENWTRIDNGINNSDFNSVFVNDNYIFVGASYATVYLSTDEGSTWENISDNLHSTYGDIISVFADDSVAYVGLAGKGVWTRPLEDFVVAVNNDEISTKFLLEQNYPNPFNPSTTIEYSIPKNDNLNATSTNVQLKVYDVLGRKVTTLVNGKQSPGTYRIHFNATNLPSGIYFYSLKAGNFKETKKMLLMK